MKWIVIILLAANLAIFAWGWQRQSVSPHENPPTYPEIGQLRLLSELDRPEEPTSSEVAESLSSHSLTVEEEGAAGSMPPIVDVVVKETPVSKPEPEPELFKKPEPEPKPEPERRPEYTSDGSVEAVIDISPPAKPPQIEASGSISGSPGITESDQLSQEESVDTDIEVEVEVPEPLSIKAVCGAFGPFSTEARAKTASKRLLGIGVKVTLRREADRRRSGYWVMIPPLESEGEAISMLQKLRKEGIKDISRFFRGDNKNGLSLGAFTHLENAESRKKQFTEKGYELVIKEMYSEKPTFWIDYYDSVGQSAGLFAEMESEYQEMKLKPSECQEEDGK